MDNLDLTFEMKYLKDSLVCCETLCNVYEMRKNKVSDKTIHVYAYCNDVGIAEYLEGSPSTESLWETVKNTCIKVYEFFRDLLKKVLTFFGVGASKDKAEANKKKEKELHEFEEEIKKDPDIDDDLDEDEIRRRHKHAWAAANAKKELQTIQELLAKIRPDESLAAKMTEETKAYGYRVSDGKLSFIKDDPDDDDDDPRWNEMTHMKTIIENCAEVYKKIEATKKEANKIISDFKAADNKFKQEVGKINSEKEGDTSAVKEVIGEIRFGIDALGNMHVINKEIDKINNQNDQVFNGVKIVYAKASRPERRRLKKQVTKK